MQFRKYVTLPMLFMILESKSIEEELCNIIRDKDREIEDYKSSSAQLTRRTVLKLLYSISSELLPLIRLLGDPNF